MAIIVDVMKVYHGEIDEMPNMLIMLLGGTIVHQPGQCLRGMRGIISCQQIFMTSASPRISCAAERYKSE